MPSGRERRSEFEGRRRQRAVIVGGAHFSAAPQGQVFGPSGICRGITATPFVGFFPPPLLLLSLSLLHLCDRKCPCDTSFDCLYNAAVFFFFFSPAPPSCIEDVQSVTDERLSVLRWTKVSVFVVENQQHRWKKKKKKTRQNCPEKKDTAESQGCFFFPLFFFFK